MGININSKENNIQEVLLTTHSSLEKDLKSCMRCRFFYGKDSRCIAKRCYRESNQTIQPITDIGDECYECPYKQNEGYCFPCMKKILGKP